MNRTESTGRLVWRLIYPFLIFIGVELVIELPFILHKLMPILKSDSIVDIDIDALTKELTQYVLSKNNYIIIIRMAVICPIFYLLMRHDKIYDIALNRHKEYGDYKKIWLLMMIPAGIAAAIGFNGAVTLSGIENFSPMYKEIANIPFEGNIAIVIISSSIAAPLVEEMLIRGLLYSRLRHYMRPSVCMIITALAFGLIHGNLVQFVYAFLNGIVFAYVYERFKTIWASVLMHAIANFTSVVVELTLGNVIGRLTIGDVMIISVVAIALLFFALKLVDKKVDRQEINMI